MCPQESGLGPSLFLLYMTDLPFIFKFHATLIADDSNLQGVHKVRVHFKMKMHTKCTRTLWTPCILVAQKSRNIIKPCQGKTKNIDLLLDRVEEMETFQNLLLHDYKLWKSLEHQKKRSQNRLARVISWQLLDLNPQNLHIVYNKMPFLRCPKSFEQSHKNKIGKSLKRVDSGCMFLVFYTLP